MLETTGLVPNVGTILTKYLLKVIAKFNFRSNYFFIFNQSNIVPCSYFVSEDWFYYVPKFQVVDFFSILPYFINCLILLCYGYNYNHVSFLSEAHLFTEIHWNTYVQKTWLVLLTRGALNFLVNSMVDGRMNVLFLARNWETRKLGKKKGRILILEKTAPRNCSKNSFF